jgi:hypothetical protein
MNTVVIWVGVISFLLGLFFTLNAFFFTADTVLQQIYLALEGVKALLAFLIFTVCAVYARIVDMGENKKKEKGMEV